jgi:hypothetical protein
VVIRIIATRNVETVVLLSRKKATSPRLEVTVQLEDEDKREALIQKSRITSKTNMV